MNTTSYDATDRARRDRAAIVAELTDAGAKFATDGKTCRCPWHDDENPSAGIFEKDGVWRFKCHACGDKAADLFDVKAKRTGRPVADVLREFTADRQAKAPARGTKPAENLRVYPDLAALRSAARYCGPDSPPLDLEDEYHNANPDTKAVEMIVFRLLRPDGDKTFRQGHPVQGGWALKGPPTPWPIWNRTRLRSADYVVVVEGEKTVKALTPILPPGWAATTAHGGAGKGSIADWSPLAGKAAVYLWADNDPPDAKGRRKGLDHMRDVARELAKLLPAPSAHWINPDTLGLPPKGDAVDWIARESAAGADTPGKLADALDRDVLAIAAPLRISAPLLAYYRDVAAGKLTTIPWPWPNLTRMTQALQPGHLTALCGEPGAGKSFMLVEALDHWLNQGTPAACLMLELSAQFHARRLHAMLAETPGLLDTGWVKANANRAESLYAEHAARLDRFWGALDTVPTGSPVTAATIIEWLKLRCQTGARILVADPFTAIADDHPWVTDPAFMLAAQKVAEEFGASIVLTVHPDRGGRKMARSEGLRRLVDTVFWLAVRTGNDPEQVITSAGRMSRVFNRRIRVTKARLAAGSGTDLAYDWSPERLRFSELGVIVKGADARSDSDE